MSGDAATKEKYKIADSLSCFVPCNDHNSCALYSDVVSTV